MSRCRCGVRPYARKFSIGVWCVRSPFSPPARGELACDRVARLPRARRGRAGPGRGGTQARARPLESARAPSRRARAARAARAGGARRARRGARPRARGRRGVRGRKPAAAPRDTLGNAPKMPNRASSRQRWRLATNAICAASNAGDASAHRLPVEPRTGHLASPANEMIGGFLAPRPSWPRREAITRDA